MNKGTIYIDKRDDGIAYIYLNRPERKNAIDASMMEQMTAYLDVLDRDDSVRVIVLTGQGENFTSGGDLKQSAGVEPTIEGTRSTLKAYTKAVQTIQQLDKPVVAAVRGYAIGGGMSLAMACDIVFASETAKFCCNFLKIGIVPEMGAMLFMPQTMNIYKAKELWFTGKMVSGAEAAELGFVNHVLPDNELDAAVLAFAQDLAKLPAMSVRITKRLVNSTYHNMLNAVLDAELEASPFCAQTKEHKDTIAAFMNKGK